MRSFLLVMVLSGACIAQPATQPAAETAPVATPAAADLSTDELLDAMERVGLEMKTLNAKVQMKSVASLFGGTDEDAELQNGTIWLQRLPDGDTKLRVRLDDKVKGRVRFDERHDFLLSGDWLEQRDYAPKNSPDANKQTLRQVRRPGQKVDLLKLGEGPFPLPIGQPRERVKEQFTVSRLPIVDEKHPTWVLLELRPRKDSGLDKKYESILLSVDPADALPRVIETVDADGSLTNTTTLSDVKLNDGVTEADFTLEPIKPEEWETTRVPLDAP